MIKKIDKNKIRKGRHQRIRNRVSGTAERPRLCVYRSLNHIYAQVIDDVKGVTITSASTVEKEVASQVAEMSKTETAKFIGDLVAKRAMDKDIKEVVFDRGGYVYTGRVAALADGAREAGLKL